MSDYARQSDDNGEPIKCDCCGYWAPTEQKAIVTEHTRNLGDAPRAVFLCEICSKTPLSLSFTFPSQCPDPNLHQAVGWIANRLLEQMRTPKQPPQCAAGDAAGEQGVLALTGADDQVQFKIVCGCDGKRLEAFAESLTAVGTNLDSLTPKKLWWMSEDAGIGCRECLVVLDGQYDYHRRTELLGPLYRGTFGNPWFNPRGVYGAADTTLCLNLPTGRITKFRDPRW